MRQHSSRFSGALVLMVFGCWFTGSAGFLGFTGLGSAYAQQMPDPSLINGKALPAGDLQTGTVTVRLVRESIGNNIIGSQVTITVGSVKKTATTDEQGRAEFKGLPAGAEGTAEATVDGERLVSDPLTVPRSGGLRVILVSGLAKAAERKKQEDAAAAAAPAVRGNVTLGGNSRIVFEFPDDLMRVYYMLEIVNNARTRVDIGGPLVIDLPAEAAGTSPLEGSSPQATINGSHITVTGPFAAGITTVQVGFQMPFDSADMTIVQKWPAPLEQVTVASQKVGALSIASPQFNNVGEVKADDGGSFILGSGGPLAAGAPLTIQISGLPVHSKAPRNAALGLAIAFALLGIWLALPGAGGARESRTKLMARRDALLGELVRIEERIRAGALDSSKDATRKQRVVAELEQIYGELDEASPRGGGEGLAA